MTHTSRRGGPHLLLPPQEPPKYDFEWGVRDSESANHFGQQETRDLDETKGSYFVLLPDGRTQRVSYYVDGDSGFVAEVSYEGSGAPAPLRRAPSPRYG